MQMQPGPQRVTVILAAAGVATAQVTQTRGNARAACRSGLLIERWLSMKPSFTRIPTKSQPFLAESRPDGSSPVCSRFIKCCDAAGGLEGHAELLDTVGEGGRDLGRAALDDGAC